MFAEDLWLCPKPLLDGSFEAVQAGETEEKCRFTEGERWIIEVLVCPVSDLLIDNLLEPKTFLGLELFLKLVFVHTELLGNHFRVMA